MSARALSRRDDLRGERQAVHRDRVGNQQRGQGQARASPEMKNQTSDMLFVFGL